MYHSLGYTSRKRESVEYLTANVSECFQHLFWAHVRPTSGARRPVGSGWLQDDAGPEAQGGGDGELPVEIPGRNVTAAEGRPALRAGHSDGVPAEGGTSHCCAFQGLLSVVLLTALLLTFATHFGCRSARVEPEVGDPVALRRDQPPN